MDRKKIIGVGVVALALVFAGPSGVFAAPSQAQADKGSNGQWIVTLDASSSVLPAQAAEQAAKRTGGSVLAVYEHALNGFAIKGASKRSLERLNGVSAVEPDLVMTTLAQTLPTGVDRIEADTNGTANINGSDERVDVDVAIIDTGVDLDHADLNVHAGVDCTKGPNCTKGGDGDDGNGHGTHVGGTVAALDNGDGVVGVAPGARIWAVKVLGDNGSGFLSDIIEGIDYVTANADQIEVANMSLGGQGQSSAFRSAIANSVDAGVFYAVAAGNSDADVYGPDATFGTSDDYIPASYPEVAAISALADSDGTAGGNGANTSYGSDDSFATFSNFSQNVVNDNPVSSGGAAIDLLLPGVDILSTWINGQYNTISGTSMASPHGAGLAALHIVENSLTPSSASDVHTVRQALIDNGVAQDSADGLATLNDPDSNEEQIGWAAGDLATAPSVTVTNPSDGGTVSGLVTLEADATDSDGSVTQVEFFVDSTSVGIDTDDSDGWGVDWDSTAVADGDYTVVAEATDNDGATSQDSVSVTVDNNAAPSVTVTNPADGATVSDTVSVTADSSDSDGTVTQVEFFVDGSSIGTDTTSSDGWSVDWDSTAVADGEHTVTAEATDDAGETASHSVTVTVDNIEEPAESAPEGSIDGVSEVNSRNPHAELDISWSASDADGDLVTVELTLTDLTTGSVEEATSIDVSGTDASGTATLKAKHDDGTGHDYEVSLTVTDASGNTTTAAVTTTEDGN